MQFAWEDCVYVLAIVGLACGVVGRVVCVGDVVGDGMGYFAVGCVELFGEEVR